MCPMSVVPMKPGAPQLLSTIGAGLQRQNHSLKTNDSQWPGAKRCSNRRPPSYHAGASQPLAALAHAPQRRAQAPFSLKNIAKANSRTKRPNQDCLKKTIRAFAIFMEKTQNSSFVAAAENRSQVASTPAIHVFYNYWTTDACLQDNENGFSK